MNISNILRHSFYLILIIVAELFSFTGTAQNNGNQFKNHTQYYIPIEAKAEYRGGEKALKKFIKHNFKYPSSAHERKVKGTLNVRFTINEDGSVSDVEVTKRIDPDLDAEAKRVIKLTSGRWQPAIKGIAVKSKYNQPFVFGK